MPKPTDYEDEAPTRVETPLPIRHDPKTLTYRLCDEEPTERRGAQRA